MRAKWTGYGLIIVMGAAITAGLVWQWNTGKALRLAIAQKHFQVNEHVRLTAEQRRLPETQASQAELEQARNERVLITALRTEINALKQRANAIARGKPAPTTAKNQRFSLKDSPTLVNAAEWADVGTETPEATFETALWAATGGDLDALARLLSFDPEARTKITSLFRVLPEGLQHELGTPERLMALLAAKDVPLGGAAKIWAQYGSPSDTKIAAQIVDADGKSKQVKLTVRQEGNQWQFVVPPSAVEKYTDQLRAPAVR